MVRSLTRARAAWVACALVAFAAAAEAQQTPAPSPRRRRACGFAVRRRARRAERPPRRLRRRRDRRAPSPSAASGDSGSMGETIDLPARPAAYLDGKAGRDEVYSAIIGAIGTVRAEIAKAGLKPVDHPIAIFLEADDSGFKFRAAVPLAAAPDGKTQLSDAVKIGETPVGKAMRFEHRGAYDDIDGTYEAITAYLDEKGVDAQDVFVEEYLNDIKSPEDPNLQVDIYVLLK